MVTGTAGLDAVCERAMELIAPSDKAIQIAVFIVALSSMNTPSGRPSFSSTMVPKGTDGWCHRSACTTHSRITGKRNLMGIDRTCPNGHSPREPRQKFRAGPGRNPLGIAKNHRSGAGCRETANKLVVLILASPNSNAVYQEQFHPE